MKSYEGSTDLGFGEFELRQAETHGGFSSGERPHALVHGRSQGERNEFVVVPRPLPGADQSSSRSSAGYESRLPTHGLLSRPSAGCHSG